MKTTTGQLAYRAKVHADAIDKLRGDKRTPWFPASVEPVRAGRYEVRCFDRGVDRALWDGVWRSHVLTRCVGCQWRGVARPST